MARPDLIFDVTGDVVHMRFGGIALDVDFSSRDYHLSEERDFRGHLCMMLLAAYEHGFSSGIRRNRADMRRVMGIEG